MHTIRRSCGRALHGSSAVQQRVIVANGSRRAFSQSAAHHRRALPVFVESSSPELQSLLNTGNAKILLLKHLTREQEDLVYKPANRARLEADPVDITIGEVTVPLQPVDRSKDLASPREWLFKVMQASKTPADWENVLRVMDGFENAGIHIRPQWQEKVVRLLGKGGMQHLTLKALQRAQKTGLYLREWPVLMEVFASVRRKAAEADWDKEALQKALKMSEQVVELMEEDHHQPKSLGVDYRTDPLVIAFPLELAAELAYRHDGDVEKVKTYALRMVNALRQTDTINKHVQNLETVAAKRPSDIRKPTPEMQAVLEIAHSMILENDMPLDDVAEVVQRQVREALRKGEEALEAFGKDPAVGASVSENFYYQQARAAIKEGEEE